jgi:hypothetical protein
MASWHRPAWTIFGTGAPGPASRILAETLQKLHRGRSDDLAFEATAVCRAGWSIA